MSTQKDPHSASPMTAEERREFGISILRDLLEGVVSPAQPVGSVDPRPPYERQKRKVEEYKGDIPTGTGNKPVNDFTIDRWCEICHTPIQVKRVTNSVFQQDDHLQGGQIVWLKDDVKAFALCPLCSPVVPLYWDEHGRYLEKPRKTIGREPEG